MLGRHELFQPDWVRCKKVFADLRRSMGRNTRLKSKGGSPTVPEPSYNLQSTLTSTLDNTQLATGHKPLYLCQPFVRSALIKGSFRTIVALPKYVNPYEWVAINRTCPWILLTASI